MHHDRPPQDAPPAPPAPPPLDVAVAAVRDDPQARWGLLDAVAAVVGLIVILGLVGGIAATTSVPGALLTLLGELSFGGVVWLAGRRAARQSGGWLRALGVRLPDEHDVGSMVRWTLLQLGVRFGVVAVLLAALSELPGRAVSNAAPLRDLHGIALVVVVLTAVLVAPVVEEALFRGLLLRAVMLRAGFWTGAIVSSVLFGVLHAVQGPNLPSVVLLGASTLAFGLVQCLLVRRTGTIGTAIGVHSLTNGLAIVITLAG